MAKAINMPQVGQDIETAVISEWKVNEGDTICKGDVIATVESDKAVFEVEAFESGTILKLVVNAGEEGKVFEPIAYVGEPGEKVDAESAESTLQSKSQSQKKSAKDDSDTWKPPVSKVMASPSARRLAREHDIDLHTLTGSGPNGRIIKRDILEMAARRDAAFGPQPEAVTPAPPIAEKPSVRSNGKDHIVPFSKIRQSVADRLSKSWRDIPHFYLSTDVDMTSALAWREAFNTTASIKISVNDLIIRACAAALQKYPNINAHVHHNQMIVKSDINIGVAVSVPDGLIVPVIPHADKLNLKEIASASKENAAAARRGVLKTNEPGTFTISNLGMYEISEFQPIINPPEAGILGIGSVTKKLVLNADGTFGPRKMLKLTLASDHRAVDGAYAAQFLNEIKYFLEHFNL